MRIIVTDSCSLIDLRKGGLLHAFLELPHELIIPESLLHDELLSFSEEDHRLMRRKMTVAPLDGVAMTKVRALNKSAPALSIHDCMAFVIAQNLDNPILLTGDRRLRTIGEAAAITCHGVLWAVDEIAAHQVSSGRILLAALEFWRDDPLVRLPGDLLRKAIAKYRASR